MFSVREIKQTARRCLKGNMKAAVFSSMVCGLILALLCTPTTNESPFWLDAFTVVAMLFSGGSCLLAWCAFFLHASCGDKPSFWDFLQGFEHFLVGTVCCAWCVLWIFLWSLLFVIPGIVKAFSYSMVFFVIADNPRLGARKALAISKVLTRGHKGDLFVLAVSFLLWEILAALTLEILQLWLSPYVTTSFATSYWMLKEEALRTGSLTVADFQA